jgi:hypothetical protein
MTLNARRMADTARAAILVSLLAACSTGPEYKPRLPGEQVGYTDQQLSPTRYRVAFSGSTASNRDDVENYLLRRAAEVTVGAGYTHFALSRRDTERSTYYIADSLYGPYYYYYPYRSWYWGDPYGPAVWPVTTYFAFAEIVMLSSDQAANNAEAIEALTVLARSWLPAPVASADQKSRS